MELTNAIRKTVDNGPGAADPAVREAVEQLASTVSLFAPYTAEDMWERLGHEASVANVTWGEADEALLVDDTVTAVVQVTGKVRARLEVDADITADERSSSPSQTARCSGRSVSAKSSRPSCGLRSS